MAKYQAAGIPGNSAFMQAFGNAVSEQDTATIPATLANGDTVDLLRVAGGTELHTLSFKNGALDTGGGLVYSLGYRPADAGGVLAAAPAAFGAGLTTFRGASSSTSRAWVPVDPITFNEDVVITLTVTAGAAGMAGQPTINTHVTGKARGIK